MEMYIEDLPDTKQEKFQRQFKKIKSEVERLQYLMTDMLVLGRANAARTPFHPQEIDLVEFCKDIIDNKFNNRYAKARSIIFTTTGDPVGVSLDPKLLDHAIENILCNAYKYSKKGHILFEVQFSAQEVKMNITDHGIGIPEEDLKVLFQPFHRGSNTAEIDGTGLGLAIVKEFIEKHSGQIFLASKLNKGTTVSVILPIKQNLS
jgi:signal transduction histidine kinase